MNAIRIEATIEADGELHLTALPYRRGDKVEAIVLAVDQPKGTTSEEEREKERAAAVEKYLALTEASTFCSTGPYPTREELHERH